MQKDIADRDSDLLEFEQRANQFSSNAYTAGTYITFVPSMAALDYHLIENISSLTSGTPPAPQNWIVYGMLIGTPMAFGMALKLYDWFTTKDYPMRHRKAKTTNKFRIALGALVPGAQILSRNIDRLCSSGLYESKRQRRLVPASQLRR